MSLIRLLRAGTLVLGIAALACEAASNPQPTGCQTDYDCKSDRYCVNGQCVGDGYSGSDSQNGQGEYSCESGAEMYVKLCCAREEFPCKGEKPGSAETPFQEAFEECSEEIARGESMQEFFYCVSQQCAVPGTMTFFDCKQYWP